MCGAEDQHLFSEQFARFVFATLLLRRPIALQPTPWTAGPESWSSRVEAGGNLGVVCVEETEASSVV